MRIMILGWFFTFATLSMLASTAGAGAITSYTATDLGVEPWSSEQQINLSNTGANGTLTTPAGVVYAFPRTDNRVANPQPILDTFPPLNNAPIHDGNTYGNPKFAYSYLTGAFLNREGDLATTDIIGVAGHSSSSGSAVMVATRQADGSFGRLGAAWGTSYNYSSGGQVAYVGDLNNVGQLLGVDSGTGTYYGSRDAFIYDLHSGLRTELASLLPNGWYFPIPIAIDDQGRVLVAAESITDFSNRSELFLLTPTGLSSAPIPAPEPSTFAILAVAGVGLLIRRRWKKSRDGAITSTNR